MSTKPEALALCLANRLTDSIITGHDWPNTSDELLRIQAAEELRRLYAENEAKDALLRQAWAVIRWQCFGECRTDGVHGLPTPSEIDAAIRQHLGQKGETG